MLTKRYLLGFALLVPVILSAQSYISYFTGDTSDVTPTSAGGTVLMGGATENDNALRWFLQRANGGDVVVIRASGSNGYNNYLYSSLGVSVNSVQSIVTPDLASANDPYVAQQVRNAEALWMAGGDQWNYVSFWKDGPVGDAIRYLINEKKVVIGGTSAGMAVLGEAYFSAQNGTVTSAAALANPYTSKVSIGYGDFLHCRYLENLVADTHYDNPDRRGRQVAFLARLSTDHGTRFRGIACEEYTAVCVDTAGNARVFGGYPQDQDYAFFLQITCETPFLPETCIQNAPLDWRRDNKALSVCKIAGKNDGSNTFSLNDWKTTSGGTWEHWWVEQGVLKTAAAANAPDCLSATEEGDGNGFHFQVFPNPTGSDFCLEFPENQHAGKAELLDAQGLLLQKINLFSGKNELDMKAYHRGIYFLKIQVDAEIKVVKLCRI